MDNLPVLSHLEIVALLGFVLVASWLGWKHGDHIANKDQASSSDFWIASFLGVISWGLSAGLAWGIIPRLFNGPVVGRDPIILLAAAFSHWLVLAISYFRGGSKRIQEEVQYGAYN